jgi:hypothetical protein
LRFQKLWIFEISKFDSFLTGYNTITIYQQALIWLLHSSYIRSQEPKTWGLSLYYKRPDPTQPENPGPGWACMLALIL